MLHGSSLFGECGGPEKGRLFGFLLAVGNPKTLIEKDSSRPIVHFVVVLDEESHGALLGRSASSRIEGTTGFGFQVILAI